MPIALNEETKAEIVKRLRSYALDELDREIGELKAIQLLDFIYGLVGASAYNQGVADAQAWLGQRLVDMTGDLHEDVDWRL